MDLPLPTLLEGLWQQLGDNSGQLEVTIAVVGGTLTAGWFLIGRLRQSQASRRTPPRRKIREHLTEVRLRLGRKTLPGLEALKFADLEKPGFRTPFSWVNVASKIDEQNVLEDLVWGIISTNVTAFTPILLLSEAGTGKTTLATLLYDRLATAFIRDRSDKIPILMELRSFSLSPGFGSAEWLDAWLASLGLGPYNENRDNYIFVLDSVDELLSTQTVPERYALYNWLISIGAFVTCRTTFFDIYLAQNTLFSAHRQFRLLPWSQQEIISYTSHILMELNPTQ